MMGLPMTGRFVDARHRLWASPWTLVLVVVLGALCLRVMDGFHAPDVRPLDLFIFMPREECLVTLQAWSARGVRDARIFYALDGVWAAVWTSSFAFAYHRALAHRPGLLPARPWVTRLLVMTWLLDFAENATIVALIQRDPEVGDGLFAASRGLTATKWAAIFAFWVLLTVGVLRRASPGEPR